MIELMLGAIAIGMMTGAMDLSLWYSAGFTLLWALLITAIKEDR